MFWIEQNLSVTVLRFSKILVAGVRGTRWRSQKNISGLGRFEFGILTSAWLSISWTIVMSWKRILKHFFFLGGGSYNPLTAPGYATDGGLTLSSNKGMHRWYLGTWCSIFFEICSLLFNSLNRGTLLILFRVSRLSIFFPPRFERWTSCEKMRNASLTFAVCLDIILS